MARIGFYYGLCNLIDHKSLLGISEDYEDSNVIVTLGKNMAIKLRLENQDQIASWTTRGKFTSPVIYDPKTYYNVAVFNQLFIRCWKEDHINLDKVKKFKFNSKIDTLVVLNSTSFVIFETGDIVTLEYALANHKTLKSEQILDKNENILDKIYYYSNGHAYFGLLVGESNKVSHLVWTSFSLLGNRSEYTRIPLGKDNCGLVGYCFQLFNRQINFVSIWSDGELYVKPIDDDSDELGEMFCIIDSVSCKDPVALVGLDNNYLAIYGCNSNQEGALLIIYNMQFKVAQCKQPFKMQTLGAKIYKFKDNLLIPVGPYLAVIPYFLEKALLSTLIENPTTDFDDGVANQLKELNWTECESVHAEEREIDKIIKEYVDQGCSESLIIEELLPQFIEKKNHKNLKLLLRDCKEIPEKCHSKVLKYILELPVKSFKNSKLVKNERYQEDLQPLERYEFLKIILEKPFKMNNGSYWRFDLSVVLKLLNFILFLLKYDQTITDVGFCMKLVQWVNSIFSSNFQLFFVSKDERLVEVLSAFNEFIEDECSSSYTECVYYVQQILNKKIAKIETKKYSIDKIEL